MHFLVQKLAGIGIFSYLCSEDTNGYLRDTCLTAQDHYKAVLDYFLVKQ